MMRSKLSGSFFYDNLATLAGHCESRFIGTRSKLLKDHAIASVVLLPRNDASRGRSDAWLLKAGMGMKKFPLNSIPLIITFKSKIGKEGKKYDQR